MNIVELDGYAANPGDLSWEALKAFGNLTVYPRTAPEDVVERAKVIMWWTLKRPTGVASW